MVTLADIEEFRTGLITALPQSTKVEVKTQDFKLMVNAWADLSAKLCKELTLRDREIAELKSRPKETIIKYTKDRRC